MFLHTFQGTYEVLADATADVLALDGTKAGTTLDWHDRPAITAAGGCHVIGNETNGCEIIASGYQDATDAANGSFRLYGYVEGGPAEYIADISCTLGMVFINDVTTAMYVDTMTIAEQTHLTTVTVKDTGNNRVAKLRFDVQGYRYICCRWYDVSSCYRAYIRGL